MLSESADVDAGRAMMPLLHLNVMFRHKILREMTTTVHLNELKLGPTVQCRLNQMLMHQWWTSAGAMLGSFVFGCSLRYSMSFLNCNCFSGKCSKYGKVHHYVEFICSPHVCVGHVPVTLPSCMPTIQSIPLCCDRLASCPGCTTPLAQWQLV